MKAWTQGEDDFMRLSHHDYSVVALAGKFDCSTQQVRRRLAKLGLTRRVWTEADEKFLRQKWLNGKAEELRAEFPHLTWASIKEKAEEMGLCRFRIRKTPTQMRAIIALHQAGFTYSQISESIKGLDRREAELYLKGLSK